MTQADTAALERILAYDLTYTHSSGHEDSRSSLIESLKTGALKYLSIDTDEVQVRVYGKAAVVTGTCRMKVDSQGQEFNLRLRFTDIYVKRNSRWQMVAWQSTRLSTN